MEKQPGVITTSEGKKVYSTEHLRTQEERDKLLKKQQERDFAYSQWLLGKGPHPDEMEKPKEKPKDNVVNFPQKEKRRDSKAA